MEETKKKIKLSYSIQTHNWVEPQKMIIKRESNEFHFEPQKCL